MTGGTPAVVAGRLLVDRLHHDGIAEVFRAIGPDDGRIVAVERVADQPSADAAFVARFAASARVAAGLAHPNLLRVEEIGRDGAHLYLVTELPDGRDLGRVLRRLAEAGQRMPPAFVAWVGFEACRALHHLHTRTDAAGGPLGLVHGALAPSALLLGFDGVVRLAPPASAWSAPDDVGYVAPERHGGAAPDPRADVWALGVVLHEALTGRRAFPGDDVDVLVAMKRGGHLPRPAALVPGIPEALSSVVTGAVRPDPSERYATARAFGEALRAAALADVHPDALREALAGWLRDLDGEEVAAERVAARARAEAYRRSRADAWREAVRRQRRFAGGMLVAVATGAMALGVAALAWRPFPAPEPPRVVATGALHAEAPAGARVFVDDVPRGEGTVRVEGLTPGTHTVRVETAGAPPRTALVPVLRGGRTRTSPQERRQRRPRGRCAWERAG